ncbi:hypothetical protein GCM10027176_87900 [Actinoallomurus bryophytorum]|uniref:Uncharacterized protein n=1 Tax=Actinoallomurus bryophytorum TaxID=1490222 RepID=A0A543CME6_9ACTN|nr:hypothetical protein [Actinoallomurus bryophytorum]TQL98278.1 hypothetical protein FB559_3901 [Actinoallomurus bryophytorum]
MTRRFGDQATFAVEVGEAESPQLRIVDLWAAGKRLTTDDNSTFLPFFCPAMRSTAAQVRRRDVRPCPFPGRSPEETFRLLEQDKTAFREHFWFMEWGETVDNVSRYAYLDDDLILVFAFRRPTHPFPDDLGTIFVARIPPDDFATTLQAAAELLDADFAR